jgi:hypothetical protein
MTNALPDVSASTAAFRHALTVFVAGPAVVAQTCCRTRGTTHCMVASAASCDAVSAASRATIAGDAHGGCRRDPHVLEDDVFLSRRGHAAGRQDPECEQESTREGLYGVLCLPVSCVRPVAHHLAESGRRQMIFAGIDVNIITHPKALAAGPEALGLWLWGMCYAQLHETDGRLPKVAVLSALGLHPVVSRRLADRLVVVGLWASEADGSWSAVNYGKKNQTSDEIRRKKDLAAERTKRWRDGRRDAPRDAHVTLPERIRTLPEPEPSPEPDNTTRKHKIRELAVAASHVDDVSEQSSRSETRIRVRGSRLPDGWTPGAEAQAWAKAQGVTDPLGAILDDFRDYWAGIPGARGTKLDWDATYRNRVRQVGTRAPSAQRGFGPIVQSGDNRAWKIPENMP